MEGAFESQEAAPGLYERIGGRDVIARVHKVFYDLVYAHPWLGQYFRDVDQALIEAQQTDFIAQAMGGPATYCGKPPVVAHRHILITEELFDLRHELLARALSQVGVPPELAARWLKIDGAFRARLVKRSAADCQGRFKTEPIKAFPRP